MRIFPLLLTVLIILAILSLSQAVGRLFGFGEYLNASVLLALLVFLALANIFFIRHMSETQALSWGGMIAYLVVVFGLGFTLGYRSYTSTPHYLVESIAITVKVTNDEGTTGHVEASVQVNVLRGGLDQILWGNLGSTGIIKNPTVSNLNAEYRYEIVERAGKWQVRLLFPNPLKKGQRVNFNLGFDIVGAAPEEEDSWEHAVTWPTQSLQINLIVPKKRACKAAEARSEDAVDIGANRRDEPPPLLSEDNTKLTWTKPDPEEGRAYIVTCHRQ